jgi:hypothetical protein
MRIPSRVTNQAGRFALVDGIPFRLPVTCEDSPVLMAAFTIDAERAQALIPGNEVHVLRLLNGRGLLLVTVIDYRITVIGKYIEYSIGIACTHGARPGPRIVPAMLMKTFGTGQFVIDLPVSSEVSVKGGKGIWGMPKHQAALDFQIGARRVSSMYALDGQEVMTIDIDRPASTPIPMRMAAANYCAFRGMLMKSYIYFKGRAGVTLMKKGAASIHLGTHPRAERLRALDISSDPLLTAFIPSAQGTLDDHFESWFLTEATMPTRPPEGFESVIDLGLGEDWLPPPRPPIGDRMKL